MMLITPGGHTMSRFCFLLIWAFFMLVPATAAEPWSGEWKVSWPGGGGFLSLTQEGTDVRGSYRNGRGNIEATAQGAEINGEFIHDGLKEHFHATLGSGQNKFMAVSVFGVAVWFLNVTVFALPIGQSPVNVQTRNTLPPPPGIGWSNVSPRDLRSPASTTRTALAIRWAAGRENDTKDLPAPCPAPLLAPWLMSALNDADDELRAGAV
jgi:hypothetical protein